MNKTLRTCAIAGAVFTGLGSIVAAEVGLTSHLPGATAAADKATAGNVTAAKNLEQCERELHAAHSRGYTWTFVPLGYDLDGNPAIKVKGVLKWWRENGVPPGELAWIVQATECYVSKGEWWDRPINIIADRGGGLENQTIARYDGQRVD